MRNRTEYLIALALSALLWFGCNEPSPELPKEPGGILLVVLDTVRADHLSCYGYARETTPNFDRLAAEGERYDDAWSQSSWTRPAITTILTGQPPHIHGAVHVEKRHHKLRDDVTTVAERLARAGYRTAAFINVVWGAPNSGLPRGFEHYDHRMSDTTNQGQRNAGETTDAVLEWAGAIGEDPFFLVVHYFDPHLTYDAPAPFDELFEEAGNERVPFGFGNSTEVMQIRSGELPLSDDQRKSLIARYDGELRYTDTEFGRLREGLETLGIWNDSLVLVVADHGEEFWDHGGFEHGHSHFGEMLRVPLIVRRPGGPAGRVSRDRVRQLDIAPTLLEFAGVDSYTELPGHPLGAGAVPYSVAEGTLRGGDLFSVRSDAGTLIWNRTTGEKSFFEPDDLGELHPSPAESDRAIELSSLLEVLPLAISPDDSPWEPTDEQVERLRSLGYVD